MSNTKEIQSLTPLMARVYYVVLDRLYAEPGFSDVTADAVATVLGKNGMSIGGVISHLQKRGLLEVDHTTVNGKKMVFLHAPIHTSDEAKGEEMDLLRKRLDGERVEPLKEKKAKKAPPVAEDIQEAQAILDSEEDPPVPDYVPGLEGEIERLGAYVHKEDDTTVLAWKGKEENSEEPGVWHAKTIEDVDLEGRVWCYVTQTGRTRTEAIENAIVEAS